MKARHFPFTLALCCAVISVSCTEEKISTYRVAVDEAEETPDAPASELPVMTGGSLRWQALAGWQEEAPGQFQKALYTLGPATKVSVSSLPGDAGGEAANVNRWRAQIGLEPVADVGGDLLSVEGSGISAKWFDLRGPSESILASIISLGNETWFFKMNAPTAEIDARSEEFKSFLTSVGVGSKTPAPTTPQPAPPSDASGKPGIALEAPEGWEKSEGSAMRVASFRIPATGGTDGDVSVIPLGGAAGTDLENVNRWRAQLKLPGLASADDTALGKEMKGASGTLLITHMVSEEALFENGGKAAISTAILKSGEYTWFFKLAGEAGLVADNREKFEAFALSAKIP